MQDIIYKVHRIGDPGSGKITFSMIRCKDVFALFGYIVLLIIGY